MIRKPHFYRLSSRLGMINPPWKQTSGLNIGVEDGANAVLSDSFVKEFPGSGLESYTFPLPESFPKTQTNQVIAEHSQQAITLINSTIRKEETQIVAGGDHSVSLASIAALTQRYNPSTIGIIRIDSHPDMLNESTTTTDNFHGMWFRPFLELYDQPQIEAVAGGRRVGGEQVMMIGNLDPEPEESAVLDRFGIKQFSVEEMRNNSEALQQYISAFFAKYSHIHLNVDIDGFDKSVAPATGLPAEHGLLPTDLTFLFKELKKQIGRAHV